MITPNGQLDYWTLQKLLALLNTPAVTAVVAAPAEVTAAQLAALTARVTVLEAELAALRDIVYGQRSSVIANYRTHKLHRLWLIDRDEADNAVWDIQAEKTAL